MSALTFIILMFGGWFVILKFFLSDGSTWGYVREYWLCTAWLILLLFIFFGSNP